LHLYLESAVLSGSYLTPCEFFAFIIKTCLDARHAEQSVELNTTSVRNFECSLLGH
jgi:hypothetical protein